MKALRAIKQLEELSKLGKNMRLAAEEWDSEWKTLISIILSARTRDETTIKVCTNLFKKYNALKKLSLASVREIEEEIKPVNFYINKSKNISKCAKVLWEVYRGKIPHDINKLIELPGVGRKTANVFLSEYGKDAIGIDTHVSFISQKLNWTTHKDPKKIEKDLENLFPKSYWKKINPILVRFGKTFISRKKKNEILSTISKIQ